MEHRGTWYISNIFFWAVGKYCIRLFAHDTAIFMYYANLNTLISDETLKFNDRYLWCIKNKLNKVRFVKCVPVRKQN